MASATTLPSCIAMDMTNNSRMPLSAKRVFGNHGDPNASRSAVITMKKEASGQKGDPNFPRKPTHQWATSRQPIVAAMNVTKYASEKSVSIMRPSFLLDQSRFSRQGSSASSSLVVVMPTIEPSMALASNIRILKTVCGPSAR